MKKITKVFILLLTVLMATSALAACTGNKGFTGGKVEIIVDGGGDTGNFNTTKSMVESATNPFPYNELETLLKEWEAQNGDKYNVKITLRETSYGGSRNSIVPLLRQKNAPDILYQNAAALVSDLGEGYYVGLNQYFERENPYNDNKPWKDVYMAAEIGATSPDGERYYANMERLPAGIMYNKDIFKQAGLAEDFEIVTFGDFMYAQMMIDKNCPGVYPYLYPYPWLDIVLESNFYADMIPDADKIRVNGSLDAEEFCRAYEKGLWDLSEEGRYKDFAFFLKEYRKYLPAGYGSFNEKLPQMFAEGKVAMINATSSIMRRVQYNTTASVNFDIAGFPILSKEDRTVTFADNSEVNYSTQYANKYVVRGTAGLATSWFITNRAEKNKTVDACVDLMMFLTSPAQNNRMIGKMPGAVPLSMDAPAPEYLQGLVDIYNEDMQSGNAINWGAACSWNACGTDLLTKFETLVAKLPVKEANSISAEEFTKQMTKYTKQVAEYLPEKMLFDKSKW